MPDYKYKAADINGKISKGKREAANEKNLMEQLKLEKLFLISCTECEKRPCPYKKLTSAQLAEICRQLAAMLSGGITIVKALKIITVRGLSPNTEKVMTEVCRKVRTGVPLSEAMASMDGVFPVLLIRMTEAGESGGDMVCVLTKMAEHYEKEHRTAGDLKNAVAYPLMMLLLLTAAVIAVFAFVMPDITAAAAGAELSAPTRLAAAVSEFVSREWYLMISALITLVIVIRMLSTMPGVRVAVSRRLVHGRAGRMLRIIYTARFCRTFSMLYAGGINVIAACRISSGTIGCPYIAEQFDSVIKEIRQGNALSDAMEKVDGLDIKLRTTILMGEESGRLRALLDSAAESFEYESEKAVKKLSMLVRPLTGLIIMLIAAFVFISAVLPACKIYGSI